MRWYTRYHVHEQIDLAMAQRLESPKLSTGRQVTVLLSNPLGQYATPTLFEVAEEVVALGPEITPLFRPIRLLGPALTVQAARADNLPIHRALKAASPGVVLVVATGGDTAHGFWGEIMLEAALARGIAGLVIDGAVRDTEAIRRSGFPVYSAGTAIPGTSKCWPGILNRQVQIATARVRPGDWVVGDDDGVVIVPPDIAASVVLAAQIRVEKETEFIRRLREGELTIDLLGLRNMVGDSGDDHA